MIAITRLRPLLWILLSIDPTERLGYPSVQGSSRVRTRSAHRVSSHRTSQISLPETLQHLERRFPCARELDNLPTHRGRHTNDRAYHLAL